MHRSSRGEVCTLPEFVMWPPARPPWQEAPRRSPAPAAYAAPHEVSAAWQQNKVSAKEVQGQEEEG